MQQLRNDMQQLNSGQQQLATRLEVRWVVQVALESGACMPHTKELGLPALQIVLSKAVSQRICVTRLCHM
jgi:hypothetical protein